MMEFLHDLLHHRPKIILNSMDRDQLRDDKSNLPSLNVRLLHNWSDPLSKYRCNKHRDPQTLFEIESAWISQLVTAGERHFQMLQIHGLSACQVELQIFSKGMKFWFHRD